MRKRLNVDTLGFTILLGALCALPPMSIDMPLPALPQIARSFNTSLDAAALTLSLFIAGFSCAQLLFGPISDRYGRRPTLLFGCGLFTLASIACAVAPSIEILLLARIFPGCGAGAAVSMAFAMVRDCFEGAKARTRLSYVSMIISLAPIAAPAFGAMIVSHWPWRVVYAVLAGAGALLETIAFLFLAESLKNRAARPLTLARVVAHYGLVFRTPASLSYVLIYAFNFACLFAYVTGSAFLMTHIFGLSPAAYSAAFACAGVGITLGAFTNSRLILKNFSPRLPLTMGVVGVFCASVLLLIFFMTGTVRLELFLPVLVSATFSYGLVAPNAAHGALRPFPDLAGVASASLSCVQMAVASAASALVSRLNDGTTPLAMILVMLACSSISAGVYFFFAAGEDALADHKKSI